jgi:Icc-related predicted phosphoesterase
VAAVAAYQADALILGGDIAGKAVVPIVKNGRDVYRYEFQGAQAEVPVDGAEEVAEAIAFNGLYPYKCEQDEYERLRDDADFQAAKFEEVIITQIRGWRELLDERLPADVQCVITPGNDDPLGIDPVLEEGPPIACPERKMLKVGPVWLASLGNTNRTPWDTDREFDEPDLRRQIDEMVNPYRENGPMMFNFHCPPYASGLDTVVKLDADLRPIVEQGVPVEVPVGSTAVREAIEEYEPVVGLHGHIHESAGTCRIGNTICINPGSDYGSGWLKGAIVDFDEEGSYVGHLLTSG